MNQISVIVPVYNVEQYLIRCIKSVLRQTYRDFELILVDDGSPDNSGKLCDEWAAKDNRIKVIHKANGGLSSARNAGLDIAVGEYVTFIDSDDVIHPQYLEYLLNLCTENRAYVSMGRLMRFSDITVLNFDILKTVPPMIKTGVETLYFYFDKTVEVSDFSSACCKLYHRSLFQNLRFPEGRLFEDEFVTYQLYYKAEKVAISENILYFYFINNTGITRNLTVLKRCDEYDAQWERIHFFRGKKLSELYDLALKRYLSSAQWDLIESYKMQKHSRISRFQEQFRTVLDMAKEAGSVNFYDNYDCFVIAYPKRVIFYRIVRKISKIFKQK